MHKSVFLCDNNDANFAVVVWGLVLAAQGWELGGDSGPNPAGDVTSEAWD